MKQNYSLYLFTSILIVVMLTLYTITHFVGISKLDYVHQITGIFSLIITVVLLFYFSIKEFHKKINKENYYKILLLPLSYTITNIIAFSIFADASTGWEYSYGFAITLIWSIFIFTIIAVSNLVILSTKKKTKEYSN